jgi:hypothetical protein
MTSFTFLLALFLSLPAIAVACSCIQIDFESALKKVDSSFRGTVVRQLNNVEENRVYEVRVNRLFKGCNFKQSNHIIVSTVTTSCGVFLNVNASYSFSGYRSAMNNGIKKQLGNNPKKISQVVSVTLCNFISEWSEVPAQNLKTLRRFDNSKCVAKCDTGGDCLKDHYCDKGKCVALNKPCPTPLLNCFAEPCSVATCTSPSKCYDDYCGGCNAIFVDKTGTRICN